MSEIAWITCAERKSEHEGLQFYDASTIGCAWNHLRAIKHQAETGNRLIICEDDAILCDDFKARAEQFIDEHPDDCISFYLGRGAPTGWQECIANEVVKADADLRSYISLPRLLHCVSYSLTVEQSQTIIRQLGRLDSINRGTMIDELISTYITRCIYSWPCLADHTDVKSVVPHTGARPTVPRTAWRFAGRRE